MGGFSLAPPQGDCGAGRAVPDGAPLLPASFREGRRGRLADAVLLRLRSVRVACDREPFERLSGTFPVNSPPANSEFRAFEPLRAIHWIVIPTIGAASCRRA